MRRIWTKSEITTLNNLYSTGVPVTDIAERLGRGSNSITNKTERIGLSRVRHDRRSVNETVFTELNPERAWLLGLLFADGSLDSARHTIALSSTDRDLIEKAQRIFESDYPIHTRNPADDPTCHGKKMQHRLSVNSKATSDSLDVLGIPRRKSDRATFPPMEPDLQRHFIRGVFDGDGGITVKSAHQAYFAGPTPFAELLYRHLTDVGIDMSRLYYPKQTIGLATFHIWTKPGLQALYDYMYTDTTVFCQRKYDIWQIALQRISDAGSP